MDTEALEVILQELESRTDLVKEERQRLDGIKRLLNSPHYSTRKNGERELYRLVAQIIARTETD